MKALIQFTGPFTAQCKVVESGNQEVIVAPGEYQVNITEGTEFVTIEHSSFSFSVSRYEWNEGKFFKDNKHVSLRYLEKIKCV